MNLTFEPIRLEQQNDYKNHLAQCPEISSDYSFVNLWGWAEAYGLSWSWQDRLVWIRQTRPTVVYWAPIGPWDTIDWQRIFELQSADPKIFIRIPEQLAELWNSVFVNQSRMTIRESRGHWDYLYTIEDLVKLKGNRYHKKKNLLNQFQRQYRYKYGSLSPETVKQAMNMQNDWCTWRDCESSDTLSSENRVIEKILIRWENLIGLCGGFIMVDGNIIAYTVAEQLTKDTLLIHFEKANPDFKGAYQAINQMFLNHADQKFSRVNREQDLDEPSLRDAKLSYHPSGFLKKYHITFL